MQKKNLTLTEIATRYNDIQSSGHREVKNLNILFNSLKMKIRKENNNDKVIDMPTLDM